ncbi:MAG: metallophosphoesterase, partial [Tannerellaceae bacterium]
MPTFFIVLLCLYLIGNIYIFRRARQALVAQSTGVKVLLGVLYWMCAVSFFSSFLFRNVDLPDSYAHTVHEIGTGWLVFTLYMVLLLGAFDLLRLIHIRSKNSFFVSTGLTLCLLGVGYYVYQHPDTKVINIVINRPLVAYQPVLKVIAVSDLHLGYGTDKARLQHYVRMINE